MTVTEGRWTCPNPWCNTTVVRDEQPIYEWELTIRSQQQDHAKTCKRPK